MTHPAYKPDPYAALRVMLKPQVVIERTCCDCAKAGPEDQFPVAPGNHPDGRKRRVPRCFPCHRVYRKAMRLARLSA